jgi:hypothetical protein
VFVLDVFVLFFRVVCLASLGFLPMRMDPFGIPYPVGSTSANRVEYRVCCRRTGLDEVGWHDVPTENSCFPHVLDDNERLHESVV